MATRRGDMSKYVIIELPNGLIEVPMDNKDDKTYRHIMSPSMQGMIDSGRYVLVNELNHMVDLDADLPNKDGETEMLRERQVLRIRQVLPVNLPKIWVGYFQDLKKHSLFCFLAKDKGVAKELEAPIRCLTTGGFPVACFADEKKLQLALDDRKYVSQFDMLGLIADVQSVKSLWEVRLSLIKKGILESRKTPFACADHFDIGNYEKEVPSKPVLENGGIPATVDLTLEPEQFCEQMILTLYYDERWYSSLDPRAIGPDQSEIAESQALKKESLLESKDFYTHLGSHYTEYLRDFTLSFKNLPSAPDPNAIRRLVMQNQYLRKSKLAE